MTRFLQTMLCISVVFLANLLSAATFTQVSAPSQEPTDPVEQFILCKKYIQGDGVPRDTAQAVKWCRKAAEQGHAEAQFNLGVAYHAGLGVSKDDAEALKWYRKAAEQGYAEAQNSLGTMYTFGQGVPKDYVQAYL